MIFEQKDQSIMGEGEEFFKFSICYCVKYYILLELFLENIIYALLGSL